MNTKNHRSDITRRRFVKGTAGTVVGLAALGATTRAFAEDEVSSGVFLSSGSGGASGSSGGAGFKHYQDSMRIAVDLTWTQALATALAWKGNSIRTNWYAGNLGPIVKKSTNSLLSFKWSSWTDAKIDFDYSAGGTNFFKVSLKTRWYWRKPHNANM